MSTKKLSGGKVVLYVLAGLVGAAVVVFGAIAALTWQIPFMSLHRHEKPAARAVSGEKEEIAYWTCVMHPTVRQPGPGKCPVCSMDLVPVKKGAGLTLTQRQRDLIPIRTEPVGFHPLEKEIRTAGVLDFNERKLAYVSARVSGWVQQVFVDFTGTKVRENDHLVKIYSQELLPAQQEYLGSLKYLSSLGEVPDETRKRAEKDVLDAQEKLRLLGLTPQQVEEIKQRGAVQTDLTLLAPIGGTVIEMSAYRGQYLKEGDNLYKIADLSSLWMIADVYEYEIPWLRWGQDVEITCEARPGETFPGKVWFIYPYLRAETRTVKVLVEVPNPDERLKPAMYVTARLKVSLRDLYHPPPGPPYACPMHPWIGSDQPGKCSICGMDLEKTGTTPAVAGAARQATYWTCPMHPEVREKAPGKCPICGMNLVEKSTEQPAFRTVLTCGMPGHPQFDPGTQPKDGKCPVCGMNLLEKQIPLVPEKESQPLFKYVCPDHPDQVATEPGKCPLDGKELVITDEVLAVPKSAVIDTGERTVVYADKGDAGYVPTNVVLGPEAWATHAGDRMRFFPILKGLQPGEVVVTHGNFLLDSETQVGGEAAMAYGGAIGKEESPRTAPEHTH